MAAAVMLERLIEEADGTENPDFTEHELMAVVATLAGMVVKAGASVRQRRLHDALAMLPGIAP